MKFISKFNHIFTNCGCLHCVFTNCGCLHCAILKALYDFKEKRANKARDMQFFIQNIQNETFTILKMFKNNMKFIRAACRMLSYIKNKQERQHTHDILILSLLLVIIMVEFWKYLMLPNSTS